MVEAAVAVVISNYNYRDFVAASIESALAIGHPVVEVIVVDDGSTDGSLDVIRRYADDVVVVEQPNGGQAAAMNAGFERVTAPIVVFLDADDLVTADLGGRLIDVFSAPTVVRAQFPLQLVDEAGRALGGTMPPEPGRLARGDVRARLAVHPDDLVWQPTSGNAFRRTVLRELLPMPTDAYRICADYYLSNLSGLYGSVAVLESPGGSYRIHGNNQHFASVWSLSSIRENVNRTAITNEHLVRRAHELGLHGFPATASDFRSVTALANRLVALRLGAPEIGTGVADRVRLVRSGIEASRGRRDVAWWRRIAMATWFVAMGVTPAVAAEQVARPFVRVAAS